MEKLSLKTKKAAAIALAFAVGMSTVGFAAFRAGTTSAEVDEDSSSAAASEETFDASLISGDEAIGKEETVYVIADANGGNANIIVSDWLKNQSGEGTLSDLSNLEGIENVKGDEGYTQGADGELTWEAGGSDIYYQGTGTAELPVTVSVTYLLDGSEVSPDELAGKSGEVTIRFDYTNNQKETVKVDGEEYEVYVPFLMMTGAVFDNDVMSNITVTNGKVINDGDRCVVMGFAMPGMNESLELEDSDYTLPESVEITGTASDFELLTTVTLATNSVFNKLDLDEGFDTVDELKEQLDILSDATEQLVDGSGELYDGLCELYTKTGDLTSGVDSLESGAKELSDGASELKDGTDAVSSGAAALKLGLDTLTENNDSLVSGAKQIFETLLATANSQLSAAGLDVPTLTIDNYKETLNGVLSSLDETSVGELAYNTALSTVTEKVNANEATITEQVTAAVKQQVYAAVLAAAGLSMSYDDYENALAAGLISAEVQAQVEAAVSQQMTTDSIQQTISSTAASKKQELIDQNMASDEVTSQIEAAVEKAQSGQGSINTLISQLDSYNEFYRGIISYTDGAASAASGAAELSSGAAELASGAGELSEGTKTLYDGIGTLKSGTDALIDGIEQLRDGAETLADGMEEFKEEGTDKLVEAVNGDFEGLAKRLRAVAEASKGYQSYGGKLDSTEGSVKFIFETDSIG